MNGGVANVAGSQFPRFAARLPARLLRRTNCCQGIVQTSQQEREFGCSCTVGSPCPEAFRYRTESKNGNSHLSLTACFGSLLWKTRSWKLSEFELVTRKVSNVIRENWKKRTLSVQKR